MTHIFLYGPSGTGKSTIGKILAKNLGLPLIDLDHVIEANAGMSIPQIMEEQGEPAFRDLETAALKDLAKESESIVLLVEARCCVMKTVPLQKVMAKLFC